MSFVALLEVASMPIVQVLLISILGAFLATDYCNLLTSEARKSLNKLVFIIFTPSLIFASLAKTVTLEDIISWWFMPINIGITFLFGTIFGWLLVKTLKPKPQVEALIIAMCSSPNLGNLPIIIIPAVCNEDGSPFGETNTCRLKALSYASFSMALGGFFIWTITYQTIKSSAAKMEAIRLVEEEKSKYPNKDLEATEQTYLINKQDNLELESNSVWRKVSGFLHVLLEELTAPPTLGAIAGFIFGATEWLRNLLVGDNAPLRVIQDSITLLGDGTIPCITLILGGNLLQGLRSGTVKASVIVGVIIVKYIILPVIGIGVVKAAASYGFLPSDPLYQFVLMIQFTLPPAMNIGTMTQLFNVGQEECSVFFLWTYLIAALALTGWSTVYLWILF